ncbi:glycosyltransferase family 2 protein [Rhizosphaericola mali]|uniref:Glycosyltransferase family 2 protein n=1 Tax=Rhizosphaericola mali TaxID=2545455 RepID=A0A5P2G5S8_9BACT|nr:glycosyltransferase family 2 protein [Rhizosphaericola mali]QES89192.1 glycosyltransferase family 2 protein [Rhizosphaericola mali]
MSQAAILTVIMPAYNASVYIKPTLDSFINQKFKDWKLIVFDDASSDDTASIIDTYSKMDNRIHLVSNDINLRVARTMNKGIEIVESKYFARVDSDDILMPMHFANAINYLEQNKDVGICGSQIITIDESGNFRRKWNYEINEEWVKISSIFACPFLQSSVVMRSEVIKEVNGYREEMELVEDYELWIRSLKKYKAVNLPYYTLKYRIHDKNMSETNKAKILGLLERLFLEYAIDYPIDNENLNLHARMEFGDWSSLSLNDFKHLRLWKYNLLKINKLKSYYDIKLYKSVLNKYFTNAYLKIATQNGGILRFKSLYKAFTISPRWFLYIVKRKRENTKLS